MQVVIAISEPGADAERLAGLSERIRTELLDLDVDEVRPVPGGEPPPGARGVDVAAVGALLVSIGGSAEAISQIVTAMRAWIGQARSTPRTVEITVGDASLRLSDATLAQQDRIIEEFIQAVRAK